VIKTIYILLLPTFHCYGWNNFTLPEGRMCVNFYYPDLFTQTAEAGVLDFKSGDLVGTGCMIVCMQEWYLLSSHCVEKVCIS